MYQPHRRTFRVRPETEEGAFVKKLAAAIILRAVQDLLSSNDRHEGRRQVVNQKRPACGGRHCQALTTITRTGGGSQWLKPKYHNSQSCLPL